MAEFPLPSNLAVFKTVVGADAAAGNEAGTLTVPTGKWWVPLSIYIVLVQGITQTPQPILQMDDGTNVFFEARGSTGTQAVSTTCAYTWAPNMALSGQVGATTQVRATGTLAYPLLLPPGYRINTVTLGIGANSDYGPFRALVCELG